MPLHLVPFCFWNLASTLPSEALQLSWEDWLNLQLISGWPLNGSLPCPADWSGRVTRHKTHSATSLNRITKQPCSVDEPQVKIKRKQQTFLFISVRLDHSLLSPLSPFSMSSSVLSLFFKSSLSLGISLEDTFWLDSTVKTHHNMLRAGLKIEECTTTTLFPTGL